MMKGASILQASNRLWNKIKVKIGILSLYYREGIIGFVLGFIIGAILL